MPETYTNLYPRVCDFENLYQAYLKARRCKRYRGEVLEFTARLEENLIELQNQLLWKTYRTGRYRSFYVYEPKQRLIFSLPFRDRVVHHALVNVIGPIFEARFIYDSYACRPGKGTHAGADRVTHFLRKLMRDHGRAYCLKGDISKYFPSIDHGILKSLIRRRIACRDTLWLIDEIIDSAADPGDPNPKGIPIGNLTSQLFANIYLHELDVFVKQALKAKYYVRYMDDFVLLSPDKAELWTYKREIQAFLTDRLALSLHRKTSIFPVGQGIDFLGYRIWATHRLLRKSSVKRMKRKLRVFQRLYAAGRIGLDEINASVQSWLGHCKHADTFNLRRKLFEQFVLKRGDDHGRRGADEEGGVPGAEAGPPGRGPGRAQRPAGGGRAGPGCYPG